MTARLATQPDVASRTSDVLDRLVRAGVDVDFLGGEPGATGEAGDPLQGVRNSILDLALVGIRALRGSAADDLTTVAVLPREEYRDVLVTLSGAPTLLADLGSGARVGVGASLLTQGASINIPAGTILETNLAAPLSLPK